MIRCSDEIPLASSSIAIALAKTMTTDELNIFGNFITSIGSDLMTIAAIQATQQNT